MVEQRIRESLMEIVREIGDYQLSRFGNVTETISKGLFDYATDVDIACQEIGIERFREKHIPYCVVSEELTELVNLGDRGVLYFDPLEGTHNFLRGRKESGFGTTIGIVEQNRLNYVVFYNALTKELYEGEKGYGAYVYADEQKKSLHVSNPTDRLDIGFNHWYDACNAGAYLDKLCSLTDCTPTSASDAIDLVWVARGSLDGLVFIYECAAVHDMMTALLIEEAGGIVTDLKGNPWRTVDNEGFSETKNGMIAGNPHTHQLLLELYRSL